MIHNMLQRVNMLFSLTSLLVFDNPQMNNMFPGQVSMPEDFSCVWDNRPSTKLLAPSLIVATFQVCCCNFWVSTCITEHVVAFQTNYGARST